MIRNFCTASVLSLLFTLPQSVRADYGTAIVDAYLTGNSANDMWMYNTLVSWDGSFLDHRDSKRPVIITRTFESRWGDDGSTPHVSKELRDLKLDNNYATDMVRQMLNSFPWSPRWPNGFPINDPPHFFTIKLEGPQSGGGLYTLHVYVRKWYGVTPPVSCAVSTASISIGPVSKDAIASASAPVSVRCNADTNYKMTVGSTDGRDLIPYTSGGRVRMSFDGGTGQRPNILTGYAEKNLPIQTNVRATTVPGTALPGKYTASAVVSIEIL